MDVKDWRSGTGNTIPIHDHQNIHVEDDDDYYHVEDEGLKRGPWTAEEDHLLINYIGNHGEGRWNSLALSAGLKRTGKSCRLRWLNYLRPDVRRGNITPEEQLLILQLHSRWGNRWSKIAQYLPGRTDNEIKNYWRTRVQKQAKQLKCDVNSKLFKDTMRYIWMPRLAEKIRATTAAATTTTTTTTTTTAVKETSLGTTATTFNNNTDFMISGQQQHQRLPIDVGYINTISYTSNTPEYSSTTAASSDSFGTSQQDYNNYPLHQDMDNFSNQNTQINYSDSFTSPSVGYFNQPHKGLENYDFGSSNSSSSTHEEQQNDIGWLGGGGSEDNGWENFWSPEDIWFLHQQL